MMQTHNPKKRAAADPRLRPLGSALKTSQPQNWNIKLFLNVGPYLPDNTRHDTGIRPGIFSYTESTSFIPISSSSLSVLSECTTSLYV